ncbi:ATP-binding protein [Streptomyces sp. NPDC020801]|uniref:ATP-binding protein n=1 Tax=unclassified Streptomyces TaxID=2593676 RepID=UPI0037AE7648
MTVRVTGTDHGHTRVEVTDPDARTLPVLLPATNTAESGRGLTLIDALAQRWGVDQGAGHKTVWCELAGPVPRPGTPAASARAKTSGAAPLCATTVLPDQVV